MYSNRQTMYNLVIDCFGRARDFDNMMRIADEMEKAGRQQSDRTYTPMLR